MPWIGRKRIAFIPVYRPHAAPPDQIPTDWPGDIMRRVFFDPDANTGADRSLRAYIQAASSGRADLDAVVQEMVIIDRQDVRLDHADVQQLGAEMRDLHFDAAAIVMLGGPPSGTSERGGFLARFVMREHVGTWAMELMHVLTGFADIRCQPAFIDCPNDVGDIGNFDEMAFNGGVHPSAYTKAAIQWLDVAAIATHAKRAANYALHSVGLAQPPPSGRSTAVRIGSEVPYLMAEARLMVDQFESPSQLESGIPSEGVIVYRVQTADPLGAAQGADPDHPNIPVFLLTPTALKAGQAFTADADGGVTVRVLDAIAGGFTVRVEDPSVHLVDRSGEFHTPLAAGRPTAWMIPGQGVYDIGYRDASGSLHELWCDAQGGTGTTDLTQNAGATPAAGNPYGYVNTSRDQTILLFRDGAGTVRSLYWQTGPVGSDNLSGTADAPSAAGDPVGYYHAPLDTHHIIYRLGNGHFQELWWTGDAPVQGGGDLTSSASAPPSAGQPSAFVNGGGVHIVVYRSADGVVRDLYWTTGAVTGEDLSGTAGTPGAAGDPVAYYTGHDDTHQVTFVGEDAHLWELYWPGVAPVIGWDLTAPSGAPAGVGTPAAYYSAGTNTKHVFYRSPDGQLHEIWWTPGGGVPAHVNLTAAYGLPLAADDPAALTVEGPNTQHVFYRGTDNHIYEMLW